MSKLVKARAKSPDQIPEWARCCGEYYKHLVGLGEVTIDLSETYMPVAHKRRLRCRWCHSDHGNNRLGVRNLTTGNFTVLECLDLDEGPIHG